LCFCPPLPAYKEVSSVLINFDLSCEEHMQSLPTFSHDFEKSRILNSAQSAEFIGLSVPHFRRLYRSGKAPKPLLIGDRKYGWRAGDLVQWLASRAGEAV
jgi:prophage regulatory protein